MEFITIINGLSNIDIIEHMSGRQVIDVEYEVIESIIKQNESDKRDD